jgi:hypothetical protein
MEASPRKAAAVAAVVAIVTAVSAVMSGATVLLTTATSLSQDMQKVRMKRKRREGELEERLIMKNLFAFRESPQRPLGPCADRFGRMTEDANRQYCKQLTHLYSWEISELANLMKDEIEKPRAATMKCREEKRPVKGGKGRPCKVSYVDRLLYVLEWLNTGDTVTVQARWPAKTLKCKCKARCRSCRRLLLRQRRPLATAAAGHGGRWPRRPLATAAARSAREHGVRKKR